MAMMRRVYEGKRRERKSVIDRRHEKRDFAMKSSNQIMYENVCERCQKRF